MKPKDDPFIQFGRFQLSKNGERYYVSAQEGESLEITEDQLDAMFNKFLDVFFQRG